MKKISILFTAIIFILALAVNTAVDAQTVQMTSVYTTGDTITNTATKACSLKVANSYRQLTIQALVTKVSGTVAGTLTLQGSIDNGTTWVTVDSSAIQAIGLPLHAPTFTATNVASQTKTWIINYTPYQWFKISYTGSGTMAAILKGYILPRPN